MKALTTIFPVIFMIILGMISRIKGLITPTQKEGANEIVFNILFPIMIFNILFTAVIESSAILIVGYVFIAYLIIMIIGKKIGRFTESKYAHISPFMLTTCEGGSLALPLYLSIVGSSSNTVIFDLAGVFIAFIIIPVLVNKSRIETTSIKELIKTIFTNSFVIAVILGLGLNLLGIYDILLQSVFIDLYTNTVLQVTTPIVGMILFIIGYNLKINLQTFKAVIKLIIIRIVLYTLVIIGFFVLFPTLMADKVFMIAVLIYFMCPTGFAIPMQISPLYRNAEDSSYTSAIISLNIIITLIVYTVIVIFVV